MTPQGPPCALCRTTEGYHKHGTAEPTRTRNLCEACYIRERRRGRLDRWPKSPHPGRPGNPVAHVCPYCTITFHDSPSTPRTYCSRRCYNAAVRGDNPIVMPVGTITLASRGIRTDIPPTDPGLTPAKVWEIAHRNATRATNWLVNTGRMTPDEAAALVTLSYTPPSTTERRAA